MPRKKATSSTQDDDDTLGLAPEEGGGKASSNPLEDTVAEAVVEEDVLAAVGLGPTIPVAPGPWAGQFDGQWDPEAGITRVADKRWTLRRFAPPGSLVQVLLAGVWFLIAVTLLILALIMRDPQYIYTAPVITPLGLFMAVRLFRKWKGSHKLTVRIEETLDGPAME